MFHNSFYEIKTTIERIGEKTKTTLICEYKFTERQNNGKLNPIE